MDVKGVFCRMVSATGQLFLADINSGVKEVCFEFSERLLKVVEKFRTGPL